jgi:hypothetical protein
MTIAQKGSNGKPKKVVFSAVNPKLFTDAALRSMRKPSLEGLFDRLDDDRLIAVVGALLVERATDDLLGSIMPSYKALKSRREVTHSIKIEILRALALVPTSILGHADLVRKIRNDFAHDIERSAFRHLEAKQLAPLRALEAKWSTLRFIKKLSRSRKDKLIFRELVGRVNVEMFHYTVHTRLLNRFIRQPSFGRTLERFCRSTSRSSFESADRTQKAMRSVQRKHGRIDPELLFEELFGEHSGQGMSSESDHSKCVKKQSD